MPLLPTTTVTLEKLVMAVAEVVDPFKETFPVKEMEPLMYAGAATRLSLRRTPAIAMRAVQMHAVGVVFILVGGVNTHGRNTARRLSVDYARPGNKTQRFAPPDPIRRHELGGQSCVWWRSERHRRSKPELPSIRSWKAQESR